MTQTVLNNNKCKMDAFCELSHMDINSKINRAYDTRIFQGHDKERWSIRISSLSTRIDSLDSYFSEIREK